MAARKTGSPRNRRRQAPAPAAGSAGRRLAAAGEEICEIGRRLHAKGFAAANDGNISLRLDGRRVLCTPTMVSKGFMRPSDLCIVDMEGNQLAGRRRRSSEILLHLTILSERPDVDGVVHCHPPHATAFAVAREPMPPCVLPEVELFLGEVPLAAYATPGTQAFADTVKPFVHRGPAMLLANHGTVSFDRSLERALWWTEIVDAACRIILLARQLGRVVPLSNEEVRQLLEIKRQWGFTDPRLEQPVGDAHGAGHGTAGANAAGPSPHAAPAQAMPPGVDVEAIVRTVTEQVCRRLGLPR